MNKKVTTDYISPILGPPPFGCWLLRYPEDIQKGDIVDIYVTDHNCILDNMKITQLLDRDGAILIEFRPAAI